MSVELLSFYCDVVHGRADMPWKVVADLYVIIL